jgi:hypothetical protein
MDEQNVNETLHAMSLKLAEIWRDGYANRSHLSNEQWEAVMEAYIHVRRAITKGEDGRRFGARAAYKAMCGDL